MKLPRTLTLRFLFSLIAIGFANISYAAVILQYHHVSTDTPASTSIAPAQFEKHMQYLKDNGFTVVPLSKIVESVQNKQALADKTVAITFDDAYLDILSQV